MAFVLDPVILKQVYATYPNNAALLNDLFDGAIIQLTTKTAAQYLGPATNCGKRAINVANFNSEGSHSISRRYTSMVYDML